MTKYVENMTQYVENMTKYVENMTQCPNMNTIINIQWLFYKQKLL
jgi:hypothetical protein